MSQPHWLVAAIIGALIGYLLPHFVRGLIFLARRFHRDRPEGKWYAYHTVNISGVRQVVPAIWIIRKGYSRRFVVSESRQGQKSPMYKGFLSFERNFWVVKLNATRDEEEVLVRFLSPMATQDARTFGLYLGTDFQGRPVTGPAILSRQELSEAEVLEFFADKVRIDIKSRLMTI